jgi:serine/threonine protein kinase
MPADLGAAAPYDQLFVPSNDELIGASTRYRVVHTLGSGGNAVTVLVVGQTGVNAGLPFAAKIFRRLSQDDRAERFASETKLLEVLQHPAIMRTYDRGVYAVAGKDDWVAYPFLIAEYLPLTLTAVLGPRSRIMRKVFYAMQLLAGLAYLAAEDIVHRDIKPANIFLKGESAVVGDLGLHKSLRTSAPDITEPLLLSGRAMAAHYRTPDLVAYSRRESELTPKSDVFQLGLVLAELFTGFNPSKRSEDLLGPVLLWPIGRIPGAYSGRIKTMLAAMLQYDVVTRPSAETALAEWSRLFFELVEPASRLDGTVF